MKHPNLLDFAPETGAPSERFPRRAHIGGRVGIGFAGGGGSSIGLKKAGLRIDFAMNHDAAAIAMHAANCPEAHHYCQDIWQVPPEEPVPGEPIRFMWFSPDCKHFSKAKGGAPVEKKIRDLAWVIVLWARVRRPDVIAMENVEEFQTWGPLTADNKPCPERRGAIFRKFIAELRRLGYTVEWRELRACDYGTPTSRKRLFLQARCDGLPIVWPEPTHGSPDDPEVKAGRKLPWRTAAEIIDWSEPCHSIFLTREEARKVGVNRPLVNATMARITLGLQRYVLEAARPFIVPITHGGPPRAHPVDDPLRTVTCANRGELALAEPYLASTGGPEYAGRPRGVDRPLNTVTTENHQSVVAAHLTKFRTGSVGSSLADPTPTITANSHLKRAGGAAPIGIVAGAMVQTGYGERPGQTPRALDVDAPVGCQVAGGAKHAPVAVYMAQHNGGEVGHVVDRPLSTLTTGGSQQQLVTGHLTHLRGSGERFGHSIEEPAPTLTAGGTHIAETRAFLVKYFKSAEHGQAVDEPIHTVTTRPRFGLVLVDIASIGLSEEQRYTAWWVARMVDVFGHPDGLPGRRRPKRKGIGSLRFETLLARIDFGLTPRPSAIGPVGAIVWDIGMRMLTVRERFRAQGVDDDFEIDVTVEGKPITATKQGEMCGNMVCPQMSEALALAALPELSDPAEEAAAA